MKVAVIGGGAGGFFAAIHAKMNFPQAEVTIFEKSQKLLSKVKVSGGGRCNVTNGSRSIKELSDAYPRGGKQLKKAFTVFSTQDTMAWFESRNVPLVIQPDNCVFPVSQNSQSIIDCFLKECQTLGVIIKIGAGVSVIESKGEKIALFLNKESDSVDFDKVIVATGGVPKLKNLDWLKELGHEISSPVPSLFTFNMPSEPIKSLMGIVIDNAKVSIQGEKLKTDGPLLITHWGMSGPAILKLSAFGARLLSEKNYNFNVQVNWTGAQNIDAVIDELTTIINDHGNKQLNNYRPFLLPDRLWLFLIGKAGYPENKVWGELGKKGLNKIASILSNDIYKVEGKTTFKEEFVTCGGVSLNSINFKTMESKACPNLYFTGEVLDIDGVTGGYNFQAAWTTAFIAGKLGG